MKPLSATRRKSPSTGANTDCNKEKADNGKRRKTIFRQKQAGRLRIALSERRRRSGSGNGRRFSASRAAGNCQRNGIRSAPDAQNVGNRNKTEKLHRLQNNFTKLALCGFAFLTGTSEITEDMQRMDEINRVRPYVAKTEKPIDDDELRQYWQKVVADKVILLEDLADIAAKTSAKDLQKAVNNRNASLTASSSDKNAAAVLTYNAPSRV